MTTSSRRKPRPMLSRHFRFDQVRARATLARMNSGPNPSRRDFIKTTASAAAMAALNPKAFAAAADAPALSTTGAPNQKLIGLQVGAVSFQDEGTEQVLD